MHKTQIGILNKLLFKIEANHKDLKFDPEVSNNTFQFHLDKVIADGLVVKKENGMYTLSKKGKIVANQVKSESNSLSERRKISVHLYCIREYDRNLQTLIYTRTKHPFWGKQGFPAGKVNIGEFFVEAAKRELFQETGLIGEPVLFNVVHYLVKDRESKELLDDKLFYDFFIKEPSGDLVQSAEGHYEWINVKDISQKVTNPFNDLKTYKTAIERIMNFNGVVTFEEFNHFTSDF